MDLSTSRNCSLNFKENEKYGRILGWVYLDGNTKSVNEQMIEDGYAWGYMGETKVKDFVALAEKRKKSGK